MTLTALLILESSILSTGNANFVSLAKCSLNKSGQYAVFFSFLFLFFSLTTAYLAKGGELTSEILQPHLPFAMPVWMGSVLLALLSGLLIVSGPFFSTIRTVFL